MSTLSNYVAKLTTNENIYYVLTGNDFDFNLIDPEHPKLFAISNNYATESVISPVIAMMVSITSRSFSMENKVPFVFILDEMTTFKVRDFEKLPSVLREYGAAFLLLTQFKSLSFGFNPLIVAWLVTMVVLIGVSLFTKPVSDATIRRHFDDLDKPAKA